MYGFSDKILVDLSEVRGFGYYSGLVFEVFAEGVGYELGGGGRYDHLISQFGAPLPSIGFALHVERLQQALNHSPQQAKSGIEQVDIDFLILDPGKNNGVGIKLCQLLREKGMRIIRRVIISGNINTAVEQYHNSQVAHAIVLEAMSSNKNLNHLRVKVINCQTGVTKGMKILQLLKLCGKLSKGNHL
jgi:ATP phosphoribosyltransferase regulatory subunit